MIHPCEVIERPGEIAVAIHTHSPSQDLPQVIPAHYQVIAQYLEQIGLHISGAAFVAYYNMDMQNLDVEIGFLSAENVPGKNNIQPSTIPGGKAVSCLHVGAYDTLSTAHDAVRRWVDDKGYESAGVYYEIYLNNPTETPPEALQTQVFTLLKSG